MKIRFNSLSLPAGIDGLLRIMIIWIGFSIFLTACSPGIDFSKHGDNTLDPPENTGSVEYPDGRVLRRLECGQSATYHYTGVDGIMGVLTLHTNKSQGTAAAASCTVVVKIVRKKENARVRNKDTIIRTVVAGESMTEVMDIKGADNLVVIIRCEGTGSACQFSQPALQTGKKDRNPDDRYAEVSSNHLSARTYTHIGQNACITDTIVLHKIYLSYEPSKVGLELVAVSHCDCPQFTAAIAQYTIVASRANRRARGPGQAVEAFNNRDQVIEIVGFCSGNPTGASCIGDAEIRIAGKPL